jgi:hypothetical protein
MAALSVVSACGGATPEPAQPVEEPVSIDGEALLEDRCSGCHALSRVTTASKSRDEWQENVVRMVNIGAELNEEEQAILVDYLAQTYGP